MATTRSSLLVGGLDTSPLYELNPNTGTVIRTISNPGVSVSGMAFMNNEIFLLSDSPNMVTVLDYATGAAKRTFTPTWTLRSGLAATADQLLGLEGPWLYFLNPVTGTSTWTWLGTSSASDGMGVVGDELFVSDGTNLNVYSLTTFGLVRTLAGLPELEALGGDGGGFADQDWYSISVQTGDSLVLTTSTPGDGPGEFVNLFDPKLELYDPSGVLVASGTALADGRNETINYTALGSGQYRVHITADAGTLGEYLLTTSGATGAPQPFQIAAVTPADGATLAAMPSQVTIDFNDAIYLPSLQASDLEVDGVSATAVTIVDADTVVFTIPAVSPTGIHSLTITAGTIQDLQGTNLDAFSSMFVLDLLPPRIISSSIQQNEIIPAGSLTYVVTFDEPMFVANLDNSDFSLLGIEKNVTYTPTGASYDATGRTLTITYTNLPEDRYTLTLLSGSGQFEDLVGHALDGEPFAFPLPPNVSGDGIDGGHFSVSFNLDGGPVNYPVPLGAKLPLGSLVYDPTVTSSIAFAGDIDSFTINLDAGQAISVVVDPATGLRPTIELRDPSGTVLGTVLAGAAGQDAVLQTLPVATAGTYTIAVSSAAGTTGTFSLQVVLNAAVESESHSGAANGSRATAQNIDGSFIHLGTGIERGAVLGASDLTAGLLPTEVEPNNTTATANVAVSNFVSVANNLYHLGIKGVVSVSGDGDYYKLGILQAGDILTVTASGSPSARGVLSDAELQLYRGPASSPIFVAADSDSGPGFDALIYRLTIATTDTYYVRASQFTSSTGAYDLAVFLENVGAVPITGGPVTAETEPNDTAATATDTSTSWRAVQYLSRTAGAIASAGDIDVYRHQFTAGDLVSVNIDATSSWGARVSLLNSSGTVIAAETGESTGTDSPLYGFIIPTTGTYYVQVFSPFGGTGTYNADVYLSTTTPPPAPSPVGQDFYSFTLGAGESATLVAKSLTSTSGSINVALQDAAGNVLTLGTAGATNVDQIIQNFVAPAAGTYYAVVTGATVTQYNLVVTRGAAFEREANDSQATAQDISGTSGAIGALGGGLTPPGGGGAPVSGPIDLLGSPLSLGIASDGSFVGPTIGARLGAVEYLRFGTFLAGFTVSLNGTNYTNSTAGGAGTAFPVTMADLSSGASHAIRITGNVTPSVAFQRWIQWKDGDSYALVTTTLTNNGVTSISNTAILDNQDPDPNGVFTTSNDVVLGADLVWGSGAGGAMGLGSADTRAVVSAEGFRVTNPFDVINSPDDPNGLSADIAINIAFSLGTLTPGQSMMTTYAMVFGTTSGAVETVYSAVADLTRGGSGDGEDWYSVSVQAGDVLVLQTSTPGDGPGEFVNTFDPSLELYDPAGALVASGAVLPDGRNETISYLALADGAYRVRVTRQAGTSGEYVLSLYGATGLLPAFAVASVTPANGAVLTSPPTQITVDFNDKILLSSLQASDLTVDGISATGLTIVDGDTVAFTVGGFLHGVHNMAIAAGAIQDLQGTNVQAFSSQFTVIFATPRIVASSIQQSDVVPAGTLTYVVTFSEPMRVGNLDNSDFSLLGLDNNVTYAPTSASYNAAGTILTIHYAGLPEDRYRLTLLSGNGRFEDVGGDDLDGEALAFPIPPNPSGDGVVGGNFVVEFFANGGPTPFPGPLTAEPPLGSLIYDPIVSASINAPGDTDSYTIHLDAGQVVTVVVDPAAGLQPTLELRDPSNTLLASASATGAGLDVVLQTIAISTGGVYTIAVGGAAGTSGTYSLQVVLNAAAELESHNGSPNDTRPSAQSIDGSFLNLGGGIQRGAVQGTTDERLCRLKRSQITPLPRPMMLPRTSRRLPAICITSASRGPFRPRPTATISRSARSRRATSYRSASPARRRSAAPTRTLRWNSTVVRAQSP